MTLATDPCAAALSLILGFGIGAALSLILGFGIGAGFLLWDNYLSENARFNRQIRKDERVRARLYPWKH
jgi:hypothetical protein